MYQYVNVIMNKYTISDCKEYAKNKNGEYLSENYINSKQKLEWKCECGYIWKSPFCDINRGSWCKQCAIKK